MPGFSRDDQELIALLIRAHRRKVSSRLFSNLPLPRYDTARRLAAILRLSVLLHRGRGPSPVPPVGARARKKRLSLAFPQGFFRKRPLTRADLAAETLMLQRLGIDVEIRGRVGASLRR
jgi:exopolyphosphatase/guanosine-5'-triphosphate,3'-diphosphate pyrophosphatase